MRNLRVNWDGDLLFWPLFTTWKNCSGRRVLIVGKLVISWGPAFGEV